MNRLGNPLKKNQLRLWETVQSQFQRVFDTGKEKIITEIKQEAHSRREERYVFQLKLQFPPDIAERRRQSAVLLQSNGTGQKMARTRWIRLTMSVPSPPGINYWGITFASTGDWCIENSQHYILDVVFKEDDSRIVLDEAIENLVLFRRIVLNMVKQCDCGVPSQRNKLKKAGWSDDYRTRVFFGDEY